MFTRLDPPLPLFVLDKGKGLALGVIDYGIEHNLIWVTAIDGTGEIWCAPNPKVRMQENWTAGRPLAASRNAAQGTAPIKVAECGAT
ncbi:hypothetical protein [Altericroceibacterium endophyticum]|uniref:Uncharacterized protein n=1 Tax=Altericroceibacterium endophyticum TaxID=1808508 RepID=A0A6I4T7U4_9SPHN|nr:hypothetical protein [Altericroceibacterium endophyticum]MXO66539.1 hypothetical protein [Altericroceibacterium endophyticum]